MKNHFKLDFESKEEAELFSNECALIDSSRIIMYGILLGMFNLLLLIINLISPQEIYKNVQTFYRYLNSFMTVVSFAIVCISRYYKKDPKNRKNLFYGSILVYVVIIMLYSLSDALATTISHRAEDLTTFYVCLVISACILYIKPQIIFTIAIVEFGIYEFVIYVVFERNLGIDINNSYPFYAVFLIFITLTVSLIRMEQKYKEFKSSQLIKQMQQQAERENKLKSLFLANMSHEIRTPMNAIVGMSELALDFDINNAQKNTIRQIRSSGMSLVSIINDILDFSKIESGKMEIIPVNYDLLKLMNDVLNVVRVRLSGKSVELVIEIDPNLSSIYYGDDMRIRQVLINLAGNATKFTDKGFIIIRIENLRKYEDRDGLRISVIDSGIGIKEEDLKKLFSAFRQVDMEMNRSKEGTGLGLSISKNLVKLMGGTIGVKSEYGKGSCFYINLPQKIADEQTCGDKYKNIFDRAAVNQYHSELKNIPITMLDEPEVAALFVEKNETVKFSASKASILVVDDNEVNLQVAEGLLKKFGVVIDKAESGYKALTMVMQKKYDIIFVDHQMPGMDGIETAKKIREVWYGDDVPVLVALSANAVNGAKEMFLSNGFDDFLSKPAQGKDFAACLLRWLNSSLIEKLADGDSDSNEIPEDFPKFKTDDLDVKTAIENSGSFDNWVRVTKTFASSITKNADTIENYLKAEDFKNFTIQVHALKSSARIIGAMNLSIQAEYIELLGKKIQSMFENTTLLFNDIQEKAAVMLKLYRSYNEILRDIKIYGEKSEDDKTDISAEDLQKIINEILTSCADFALDKVEHAVDKLKTLKLPSALATKMDDLIQAVEDIEFDKIEEILKIE